MTILIIGTKANLLECKSKFGDQHQYLLLEYGGAKESPIDIIFDFTVSRNTEQLALFQKFSDATLFFNTCLQPLTDLFNNAEHKLPNNIFGFCGLPTFLNRPLLEVSVQKKEDEEILRSTGQKLGTEFIVVDDRVGFVTPRVIAMIINEAYFTVEEGTASRADIDLAMKLGTNYPYGPFEWCSKIGIEKVHELLDALYKDTKDERYKICSLLNKEYLDSQPAK